jgi:hypothetical protein
MKRESMNAVQVVSRRGFLGTIFSAGALVLGAQLLPDPSHEARGAETAPGKQVWYPSVYLGVQPHGHYRRAPVGNGNGHPHFASHGGRGRTRCGVE